MALLQHQHYQRRRRRLEVEEEVRRQMFIGVAAFPTAALVLGHAQQADYGKEAGGIGDSDAGLSEPEQVQAWQHGGSGSKRSCAAEMHNLSEKVLQLAVSRGLQLFVSHCALLSSPCEC